MNLNGNGKILDGFYWGHKILAEVGAGMGIEVDVVGKKRGG